jgi:hypothetical protein
LILKKTLPVIRALWFAVSIISSIWFLYWICYEALVWNKLLMQATPVNYVAFVLSIALLNIGIQLERISFFNKPKLLVDQNFPKKCLEKTQMQQVQQVQEGEQIQQIQHDNDWKKQIPRDSEVPPGCRFYLGYLHERPKSVEIPEECLGCEKLVDCLLKENALSMNSCA